ncbi:MAG: hypothetical protein K6F58_07650 [Bacteroidales bacterium]|nr:hypothetical protein [Bacteroidales bacterium]
MDEAKLRLVAEAAAKQRGCTIAALVMDDDNNIELSIDRADAPVELQDCEAVHRAVLAAFDRDVEDYALTVSSVGISPEEADRILGETTE